MVDTVAMSSSASHQDDVLMDTGCIAPNKMIQRIQLLRRRHWSTWVTIWPFLALYVVTITLYLYPELVWDRVTYLLHQTYIDFFHAICTPLVVFIHTFLALFTIWSVKFRARILFHPVPPCAIEQATHVLVVTHAHKGESEVVTLTQHPDGDQPPCFIFQQRKWKYNEETGLFVKPHFPTHEAFAHYIHSRGLYSEEERLAQLDTYGSNRMEVHIPEFQDVFVDHALAPFFVFQMVCVLLWCLDEYWYYSLFMGVMMVMMECVTVYQRIRNMRTLRNMAEIAVVDMEVMRDGRRTKVPTTDLLPGDRMIVSSNAACPVDAILVSGTAVVNEAMLTGESTPQLKEAPDDVDITLSAKKHARHLLFAGTHVLLSTAPRGSSSSSSSSASASASDSDSTNAAMAVVLKTGFETKQGKLLRTILHSQGRVSENSGEAFGFIGVLVVFAIAASGYLLKVGLADPTRNRWKLFLSCVQIITSVVPPELPMELSLAVNNSLMALTKLQVFCTEPFRIPFAGKVDTCCFDKTGTLTTDEMLFGGIDMANGAGLLNKLATIPEESEMVLATCHSLVYLEDDTLAGDEMEKAATSALGYRMNANNVITYTPPKERAAQKEERANGNNEENGATQTNHGVSANAGKPQPSASSHAKHHSKSHNRNNNNKNNNSSTSSNKNNKAALTTFDDGSNTHDTNKNDSESKTPSRRPRSSYTILTRFPFIAALRRMSCIVEQTSTRTKFVVVKGAPEAIAPLCIPAQLPPDYHRIAEQTASQGYRVIALAYRPLTAAEQRSEAITHALRRDDVERDLLFAGLAVYVSPLKKDAASTIATLEGGSHRCVMITGDSVQTAMSVGRDVGMLLCTQQLLARMPHSLSDEGASSSSSSSLSQQGAPMSDANTSNATRSQTATNHPTSTQTTASAVLVEWVDVSTGVAVREDDESTMKERCFVTHRRCTRPTPHQWDLCVNAEQLSPEALSYVIAHYSEHVRIWARCAPAHKESIVMDLKHKDHVVLMAGDGTNDVGALKQAHAGIAVLNSTAVSDTATRNSGSNGGAGAGGNAAQMMPQPHNEPDVPAGLKIPPDFTFTVVPPQPPHGSPFREMLNWKLAEARRKQEIVQIVKWNKQLAAAAESRAAATTKLPPLPSSAATGTDFLMESMFNAEDDELGGHGPPMIKLGDASIAAPFTCRSKALLSVCDIVRLGRSTLVTTHMMYKILALNCLTSAYTMSVLHSDGVKLGEKQMILQGMILSVCFMCMSRSKPLTTLCPQRPVTRVFHPYMIGTVFLQFALHLYSMIATSRMVSAVDADTVQMMRKSVEEEKFKPTLLNSTMFLLNTLIAGVTFAVNYRGEPFMQSIRKNRPMFIALIILALVIVYFAAEVEPAVNELFEIVTFPSQEFRTRFLRLLATDAFGCFLIEAVCLRLFTDM